MIKTFSLYKRFDTIWAIKDLNLDVKGGCFYCLLGPNGAGKTTTLKILAGLLKPSKGRVYILGKDIASSFVEIKRYLGFIPDSPFLYENLTIQEFLEFVGSIFQIERGDLTKKMDYYLDIFGLTKLRRILLRECSHGIKQRVVYISNLLHEPKLLLVDEPLVGLDPYSISLVKKLLREHTHRGNTVLMSTHILGIAEELADRIGIITEGSLIAEGTLKELKERVSGEKLEDIFLRLTLKSST